MNINIFKAFIPLLFVIFSAVADQNELNSNLTERWGSTELRINKIRYLWTVNNFGLYGKNFDGAFLSPAFGYGTDSKCQWQLEIGTKKSEDNLDYISVSIVLLYSYQCRQSNGQYKLGILNAKREEINVVNDTHRFIYDEKKNHDYFIEQNFLLREENEVLTNNQLTIFCEINSTTTEETSGKFKESSPNPTLRKDLASLLKNGKFSDVILSAQGTEFKAFKVILSARSPVFQNIFKIDPNITRIEIVDLQPDVMTETLRFMYSEEVLNIDNLELDLLVAAEKYKLGGLKILVENTLMKNLTIENAAEFYIFGDKYSATLKENVGDFIDSHRSEVFNTTGFTSLMVSNPDLFVELFDSLL